LLNSVHLVRGRIPTTILERATQLEWTKNNVQFPIQKELLGGPYMLGTGNSTSLYDFMCFPEISLGLIIS
jgi:hypothetical protein